MIYISHLRCVCVRSQDRILWRRHQVVSMPPLTNDNTNIEKMHRYVAHVGFKLVTQMIKQWKMIHAIHHEATDWEQHF